jgi:hypothetical protein
MYIQLLTMHIDINIHMYADWFDSVSGYTSCMLAWPRNLDQGWFLLVLIDDSP